MTITREQLISDWRQRLAAAEDGAASSPRAAWLARMQIRLYRFLLACYGRSKWEPPREPSEATRLVFDSAAAESLEGKPARSLSQIRSVLTAVAKAQDDDHTPGPLAGGLDYDSWVVVAAASSKLKVNRCVELLARFGLHPRLCQRGDDQTVEVPAHERQEAFDIVEQQRERLHQPPKTPRTEPIPVWVRFAAMSVLALWTTGLLTWVLAALAWSSTGQMAHGASPLEVLDARASFGIWLSLYLAANLCVMLVFLRRLRPLRPAAKKSP